MNRRLVTILLAVVLALGGATGVLYYVKGADDRAIAGRQAANVLVAAKAIPAGTAVAQLQSGGFVRADRMPADTIPSDTVGSVQELTGDGVVKTGILAGELIRRSLLGAKGGAGTLAVPSGKVAVTVSLGDAQRVAGYVQPGTKVIVFYYGPELDAKGQHKGDTSRARTLLINVEVLAAGGGAAGTGPSSLVTLAMTQQEAEKLVLATAGGAQGGGLYLGLEGDSANLSPTGTGVTSLTLFS
jgi:pilus assembly protein CpaB